MNTNVAVSAEKSSDPFTEEEIKEAFEKVNSEADSDIQEWRDALAELGKMPIEDYDLHPAHKMLSAAFIMLGGGDPDYSYDFAQSLLSKVSRAEDGTIRVQDMDRDEFAAEVEKARQWSAMMNIAGHFLFDDETLIEPLARRIREAA